MVDGLAHTLEILVLAFVGYGAVTSLFGWPHPTRSQPSDPVFRFRVVVPAHDEGHVIGGLLADLAHQTYPRTLYSAWVIADRCRDDTARVAAAAGAAVDERTEGGGGKGGALQWHLDRHPLDPDEALVVIDADNRISGDFLRRCSDELNAGHEALQAYMDVSNPDASMLTTASALSYWASNRMVQQARRRLGWSADLCGTGMCLTAAALARTTGFSEALAEDVELGVQLALAGVPVRWIHDLRVRGEMPAGLRPTIGQRTRWAAGKRGTARRHLADVLTAAVRRRSLGMLDLAIRLVQPGRTMIAMISAIAFVVAWLASPSWLLPAPVWLVTTAVQFAMPIAFLIRDGIAAKYVLRYPLLLLIALVSVPLRFTRRLRRSWYHTPHRGGDSGR